MVELLFLSLLAGGRCAPREHHRALWVWKADSILSDKIKSQEFFKFLDAPKGNSRAKISVVFLSFNNGFNKSKLSSFLIEAHKRSVRVDYLCGEPEYATPAKMDEGVGQLDQVLDYNFHASNAAKFDGIQYDVEPYALPGWPSKSIMANYVSFLDKCRASIDRSSQKLALGAAIPRWFDGADLNGLYKSVLDRTDYVAVMDYVSKPTDFVSAARNTVEYAAEKNKDVWLGAEVSELPQEKMATFFALGNAKLEETFRAAEAAFGESKGFAGVAVEWYDTYVELRG